MKAVSAIDLLRNQRMSRVSFGCPVLDRTSGGGIPLRGVTEIVGEAGSGKTQMALSLMLQCCLPEQLGGLGGVAAYLSCGEGEFPIRRLSQIAESIESTIGMPNKELMAFTRLLTCHSVDHLVETLKKKMPELCRDDDGKVRLLVVDSIAGLMRTEYDLSSNKDMTLRTETMFGIARELKWLAHTFDLAVVVINQVTASELDSYGGGGNVESASSYGPSLSSSSLLASASLSVNPALGLAWSHCVNSRIKLIRDTRDILAIQQLAGIMQDHSSSQQGYVSDDDDDYCYDGGEGSSSSATASTVATTTATAAVVMHNETGGLLQVTTTGSRARNDNNIDYMREAVREADRSYDGDDDNAAAVAVAVAAKRRRLELEEVLLAAAAEDENDLLDAVDEYCSNRNNNSSVMRSTATATTTGKKQNPSSSYISNVPTSSSSGAGGERHSNSTYPGYNCNSNTDMLSKNNNVYGSGTSAAGAPQPQQQPYHNQEHASSSTTATTPATTNHASGVSVSGAPYTNNININHLIPTAGAGGGAAGGAVTCSTVTRSKRLFILDMSPCSPYRACTFEVTTGGVVGLDIVGL